MFVLRDSDKMAHKSTDDKLGSQSPEGVIIVLKTNDGNILQEMLIIPFPLRNPRDTFQS